MQCACAILSSVAYPILQYFRKTFLNTECVFLFSLKLLSETFLILRTERDIKNAYKSSRKVSAILARF